ncbi:MAG: beta-ketoacyl synthase N-terminal-like domain-containing protein [Bacteroidia bacterium]|jgi:3-oxoacyl-(acyl-carrier-protein) synthase
MKPLYVHALVLADGQELWPLPDPTSPFFWSGQHWQRKGIDLHAYGADKHPAGIRIIKNVAEKLRGHVKSERAAVFTGSSRGDEAYLFQQLQHASPDARSSPFSTHGVYASTLAAELGIEAGISASQTCSSSAMAILNAMAWLQSGFIEQAVVVGLELPEHSATLAMLRSSGILQTNEAAGPWPLKLTEQGQGTVVASAAVGLVLSCEKPDLGMHISGRAWAMEKVGSAAGIHPEGLAFQRTMRQACEGGEVPDLILGHFPGTLRGNQAELKAIELVFGKNTVPATGSKWFTGHALGASNLVSLFWAWQYLIEGKQAVEPGKSAMTQMPQQILVNSQGFGGQACSFLVKKVE